MFVSQAHSFTQQARLAITLAWVAGYTNILTILTCGTVTSHASGTTSNLGRDLCEGSFGLAGYALFLLTTFFLGAAVSGFCTEFGRRRGWESIFVLPIMVEAGMLCLFAIGVAIHGQNLAETGAIMYFLTGTASCAMGLQNATITRISNGHVRTTHVTGVLTDFGLEVSQLVWRRRESQPNAGRARYTPAVPPTTQRLALLASIIGTFALGAGLGTLAYDDMPRFAMFVPVAFLAFVIYQDVTKPIAEIEPVQPAGGDNDLKLPAALAVYHIGKDRNRDGKIHRMPNLLAWVDRLPPETRVIILDLGEAAPLDENGAMELRAVLLRLAPQGRQLIVAGRTEDLYRQMRLAGADGLFRLENVCPDLELAIARGLSLVHDLTDQETRHRRVA